MPRQYQHRLAEFPGEWVERAACARRHAPNMAIHQVASDAAIDVRRRVCLACPVLAECRAWALTAPDPAAGHMAGGLTPSERSAIRRST